MRSFILLLIILTSLNSLAAANPHPNTEVIPENSKPTLIESAFLRFLGPTIVQIMENHGDLQMFTNERIESITQVDETDNYDVTLHVIGFEGAHGPPYKFIRMVIRIPGSKNGFYEVISYNHHLINHS